MRADAKGLFWDDVATAPLKAPRKGERAAPVLRAPPPIPDTGWTVPREFPRLERASMIAIDTETYDPHLMERGPGWARKDGHVVGLSVAVDASTAWYFPMRHTIGDNMPVDNVLRWARDNLCNAKQPKLFANSGYDIGWLQEEGVHVAGPVLDVQLAEPLLDEYARSYSLESLGVKYNAEGKLGNDLYEWCAAAYGGAADAKQRANIYRSPAALVGPYAEQDVKMLFPTLEKQQAELRAQGLEHVFDIESRLVYLLVSMRRRGVRVDLNRAKALEDLLTQRLDEVRKRLAGINVNAPSDLVAYCDKHGIKYPTTDKGNPSFAGKWVDQFIPDVAQARRLMKIRDTFIRSYVYENHVNGRIHCQFNQLRSDEYGTVSGRFSSSNPNLQNIPSRDEEWAPLVRGLYIPDEGCGGWRRFDWSQIEYRLLVHFAVGRGAEAARRMYIDDPKTDFHVMASDIVQLPRKPTKNLNFGMVYGMGLDTMAENMGRPKEEVEPMLDTYHEKFPFVRATFDLCARTARRDGHITTLLGRRARLVDRQETRKALNRRLQGSAGDIMKLAMVYLWEQGLCDVVGVPQLTVHDELDASDPVTKMSAEVFGEWRRVMETCVELKVPLLCSMEVGPDWGHVE